MAGKLAIVPRNAAPPQVLDAQHQRPLVTAHSVGMGGPGPSMSHSRFMPSLVMPSSYQGTVHPGGGGHILPYWGPAGMNVRQAKLWLIGQVSRGDSPFNRRWMTGDLVIIRGTPGNQDICKFVRTGTSWQKVNCAFNSPLVAMGALPSRSDMVTTVTSGGVSYAKAKPEFVPAVEGIISGQRVAEIDQADKGRTLVVAKPGGTGPLVSEIISKERAAGNAILIFSADTAKSGIGFFGPEWLAEVADATSTMGAYVLYDPKGGWRGGFKLPEVSEASMPWLIAGGLVAVVGGYTLYQRRKKS